MSSITGMVNRVVQLYPELAEIFRGIDQALGVAQSQNAQNEDGFDVIFGLGGLGTVTVAANTPNFDGVRDYQSLTVNTGVTVTPGANRVTVIRARQKITFNGTYNGNGVFLFGASQEGLIPLGGPAQSGGGGGGGGGNAATSDGTDGAGSQQTFPGGGVGYVGGTNGVYGAGGAHGSPGSLGTAGTSGTPGTVSAYFLGTTMTLFPGINAAFNAMQPGPAGAPGGSGGQGGEGTSGRASGGANGNGGNGGDSGGILILIAPVIEWGGAAAVNLNGTNGAGGTDGGPGGDAVAASNGGGGGGGGGGAGGSGGNGGCLVSYYGKVIGAPTVTQAGGNGGPASAAGAAGNGDGTGANGAAGRIGAVGATGSTGFTFSKQIVTAP